MCNTSGENNMIDRKAIERFTKKFPCKESALLPSLSLIQKLNGYISVSDMEELAKILNLSKARVFSTASFYSMLSLKPRGKYHIQVCTNVICSLLDGEPLFDYISKKLGIKEGEVTSDGMFSLTAVQCPGSCGHAPAMNINMEHYENLNFEKVDKILNSIMKNE
jgi:NADH-quinone oxidoreductase E subunit